ncbi:ABC transporter permease [Nocardioides lijunqiniae]|uniref:ABC transporter permease n=1 Tax=Nocardioides lijunqiniae TaxID=2760832 RepID=UPI0018777B69|nr:ABC transporter permease [Nocardioides lijunqiniae]
MWGLAYAGIRRHRGGFVGVFVAVLLASTLMTGLGVLMESGLRGGVPPERYASADVMVGGRQSLPVEEDLAVPFAERVTLPEEAVEEIAALPGVERAVADVSVPLGTADDRRVDAHGWGSAVLGSQELVDGEEPQGDLDVVVGTGLGLEPGDDLVLTHGATPTTYAVSGTVRGDDATVLLSDERAEELWPHPGRVAAVGVIAASGTDADELAATVERDLDGVEAYTGSRRGDLESLASFSSREQLMVLSSSFIGVALAIAVFVVAGTLSIAVGQRRREFALLRAVGALPGQVQGLIRREVLVVAGVAALLGVGPGLWMARVLGDQFSRAGVMPADFALAYSPVPALGAVVLCLVSAVGAAALAGRRTSRISPVEALAEADVESPELSRLRTVSGLVLIGLGLACAGVPYVVSGVAGLAAAASAALLLLFGVGLLGPQIVQRVVGLAHRVTRRSSSPGLTLASANLRGYTRRSASAVVPLALAMSFACVQLFLPTTVEAEASAQSRDGLVADYVVAAPAGISGDAAQQVAALDGVDDVNRVVRSQVLLTGTLLGDPTTEAFAAQGVDPQSQGATQDLDVTDGSVDDLGRPGTVALSAEAAGFVGADVGETVSLRLGDGAAADATVVATYERGLGFGDVTMDGETLREHTTAGLDDYLLVNVADGQQAQVEAAVGELGLAPSSAESLAEEGSAERDSQAWVNRIALSVILGYVALSVVNSLVMATLGRRRELTLLRLVGAQDRQVRAMTLIESLATGAIAVALGVLVAVPPLVGIAVGVSGQPLPSIVPLELLSIAAGVMVLGVAAVALPTRSLTRQRPAL